MEQSAFMLRPSQILREVVVETLTHENPDLAESSGQCRQSISAGVLRKPLDDSSFHDDVERARVYRWIQQVADDELDTSLSSSHVAETETVAAR